MTANRTASRPTGPSPLLHVLDLRLEVVTPLHIGNGEELIRNYDFVTEGDELVVLDIEAVYGKLFDTLPQDQWQRLANLPLNRVLATSGARDLARYRMPIARGASDEGYETVRAFIKDGFGRPYLPGSSLKGAIRTAFAMAYANEFGAEWIDGHVSEAIQRRTRREFAAQSLDQAVFGSRPNFDALRALRPSDLYAQTDDGHAPLQLVETRVTKRNGTSTATIMVEAMPSRTVLHGTMTVDADPVAHLETAQRDQWEALAKAPALNAVGFLREQSMALIDREKRHHGGSAVAAEFVALERRMATLDADSTLVWVGWGTGWTAKTYGEHLTTSPLFPEVTSTFKLGNDRTEAGSFPSSRRLMYASERVVGPVGWAQLTITPRT